MIDEDYKDFEIMFGVVDNIEIKGEMVLFFD